MNTLQELKEQKQAYIQTKTDEILSYMTKKGSFTHTLATCDYSNWDRELHRAMPEIATELRKAGFTVTSKINHGVTDWTIKL